VAGDFKKIGIDVVVGGAAGTVDQFVQYWDDKRASEYATQNPGKTMSFWAQFGTYLNFLAPAALVLAEGIAWMPSNGDMMTRVNTIAGSLAGRKATHRFAKNMAPVAPPAPYAQYRRLAAQRAAEQAARSRTLDPEFSGGIV
jgi:hypothetical protein